MATAPLSPGQMKDLASACVEAIPADLPSDIAQRWIGRKKELGNQLRAILLGDEAEIFSAINWQKTYEALGMETEYAEFVKTHEVKEDSSLWTVPVLKSVICNRIVAALRKQGVDVYTYVDDIDKDVPTNDRDPNRDGSYVVSFVRTVEADEANKNFSANELAKRGHKGITLLERLLLELGYFLTTNKHLDEKNWTLCSGSRHVYGFVPHVHWDSDDRKVYVNWYLPVSSSGGLRSRSVVS